MGAGAGIIGTFLTTRAATQNELRRLAIDTALREWERVHQIAAQQAGATVFPPALFIYFNVELLRLVSEGRLNAASYREMLARHEAMKRAVQEGSDRLAKKSK